VSFFAGALVADFAAVFAGALVADFLTGTEFFFAAAVLATGLLVNFLAGLAGDDFLAAALLAGAFLAGAFLAGADFFGATYASFSANLPGSFLRIRYRLKN
jgi:hypothetical protein